MSQLAQNGVYLTEEGMQKLKDEYEDLTKNKRKELAKKIAAARELGDLSENSAWQTAREEQSFVEGRIEELDEIFRNVKIIKENKSQKSDFVTLGCKVTVHIDGDEEEFHIVGAPEADPKQRRISHESPLGKALLGKKVGDVVNFEAPIGEVRYKITKIA